MASSDARAIGRFASEFCVPALLFRSLSKQRFDAVAHLGHVAIYAADSLIAAACIALVSWRLRRQTLSLAALQVHWHSTP